MTKENKQDRGPNKPVGDKYNGPCERHEDTHRKGPGHDWHQGNGKGHDLRGVDEDPDEPDIVQDDPPPPPPTTDDETPGTGPDGTGNSPGEPSSGVTDDKPASDGRDAGVDRDDRVASDESERGEPYLPFTPERGSEHMSATMATQVVEPEAFLPYTGDRSAMLLTLAAGFGLAGGRLRRFGHTRLHSHRRIAR